MRAVFQIASARERFVNPESSVAVLTPDAPLEAIGPGGPGRFKVLITGVFLPHTEMEIAALADIADVVVNREPRRDELLALVADVDALMVDISPVDAELLEHAPRLKAVVMYGVGTDHIDGVAAAARGVVVSNTPEAFSTDVAEHAMALLLALSRGVGKANAEIRTRREWDPYGAGHAPVRLHGKTLGLIGIGRIGRETARIAAGLGMRLLAYDPYVDRAGFRRLPGVAMEFCDDLAALLAEADAVSLHVPLTEETRGLIGKPELEAMKLGAFLVNVSRGALIDLPALREALEGGRLGGAGLDVFVPEPPDWDDPLLVAPNLVLTPHMGWRSDLSELEVEMGAVAEVRRILLGEGPKFRVNG
ncbi:MAG: NAD(P)-dependent oxidoreductase [Chloroflexota bacterium]|jgi:D-3-phosphoglycerate dehydrogenase|nr:NAD(P)-dependent oxidoreductase [Chloroflexota bacterium]